MSYSTYIIHSRKIVWINCPRRLTPTLTSIKLELRLLHPGTEAGGNDEGIVALRRSVFDILFL